jgi:hypothetical protein
MHTIVYSTIYFEEHTISNLFMFNSLAYMYFTLNRKIRWCMV